MEEYRKALLGVRPDPKIMVSRKLHKSRVLETVSEILEGIRFFTQTKSHAFRLKIAKPQTKASYLPSLRRTSNRMNE